MKEVIAVVRMNMMNQTKAALTKAGVDAFFAHAAEGRGKGFVNAAVVEGVESGYEEAAEVLGEKGKLYPKRMVTVVVPDDMVEDVVDAITAVNQTGKPGDGKIFVLPVGDAVRVRTAETGAKAIS
ncbi:MAG: P-II family nitrogen regulator [Pseudodesulfovibrio sp.]|jgi:nitrogen regulatory protein PII 2|uniref:Nitrogen fixation protein n=1 Tax=Pseudodesulfovibrio indicus TaxID=1716143 RepID=A0A126QNG9_9BACT|nr:P-II family nitrogen regulator [Pseudodesulfovibrio indicus]AMK10975.1 nitrogen fixation protein [Pseudodesulfovibrio indicus]TDT91975.1 nitrogen regulatory protein P-II family [Pseudodesulfovibrio indicus]